MRISLVRTAEAGCGDGLETEGMPVAQSTPAIAGNYTFDPFARHPFYTAVNASLVRRAIGRLDAARSAGERVQIVELGSGTGAATVHVDDAILRRGRRPGRAP